MATSNSNTSDKAAIGQKFGRWQVIDNTLRHNKHFSALCRCECGVEGVVRIEKLRTGKSLSCGCFRAENLTTHGHTANSIRIDSHEYWIWNSMLRRCSNPKDAGYKNYGGRGIKVDERWLKFENFFADMGARPTLSHSLDRIKNEEGYGPDNCKWATRTEQNRNKRNNRFITAKGVTKCLMEWANDLGGSHSTILARISIGWSEEKAVTTPIRKFSRPIGPA